jgi:hypothetical protein
LSEVINAKYPIDDPGIGDVKIIAARGAILGTSKRSFRAFDISSAVGSPFALLNFEANRELKTIDEFLMSPNSFFQAWMIFLCNSKS